MTRPKFENGKRRRKRFYVPLSVSPDGEDHETIEKFQLAFFPARGPGYSGRGGTPDHIIQLKHQEALL
jgi:hypothetical protein